MLIIWSYWNYWLKTWSEILNENMLTEWSIPIMKFGCLIMLISYLFKLLRIEINETRSTFFELSHSERIYIECLLPKMIRLNCFIWLIINWKWYYHFFFNFWVTPKQCWLLKCWFLSFPLPTKSLFLLFFRFPAISLATFLEDTYKSVL